MLIKVSTTEADIVCIAKTTTQIIDNVLFIHNWRFMNLWFELSFDLLTCVNRLDINIDLSIEITALVSYFWSLKGKTILTGGSSSSDNRCLRHAFSVNLISIKMSADGVLHDGFRIIQASKNLFKRFTFLMAKLQIRREFERTF